MFPFPFKLVYELRLYKVKKRTWQKQQQQGQHYTFFISNTFISNSRVKSAKDQVNAKQYPEAELLLFENYSDSSSKTKGYILKNKQKNKYVCVYQIIRLIIMKMKMKIKKKSLRCDINRPRSRHVYKHSKYKKCLSLMMLIYIKQHLNKI